MQPSASINSRLFQMSQTEHRLHFNIRALYSLRSCAGSSHSAEIRATPSIGIPTQVSETNLIDFRVAFGSFSREIQYKLMACWISSVIRPFLRLPVREHKRMVRNIENEKLVPERDSCQTSPDSFNHAIDWNMSNATTDSRSIQLSQTIYNSEMDFVNYIAVLSHFKANFRSNQSLKGENRPRKQHCQNKKASVFLYPVDQHVHQRTTNRVCHPSYT